MKEMTTLMEGAKSQRDRLLLAADLLTQDFDTDSSSDDSDSYIEEKALLKEKAQTVYQEVQMSQKTSFCKRITEARGKNS